MPTTALYDGTTVEMAALGWVSWIPALPVLSFLLLGLFPRLFTKNVGGILGTVSIGISALLSLRLVWVYFFEYGVANGSYRSLLPLHFPWLTFSAAPGSENVLSLNMGILLDPISVMMLFVVTFVSLMVHVYSIRYMNGEERYATYFSFLSLFTFSMLGLVVASNLFQTYIFWELVGVSSFLLIGFHYDRSSAVAASKKAFIVTRFADLGFLVGILILSFYSNTLDIHTLLQRFTTPGSPQLNDAVQEGFLGISAITWGLVLVFIGGAGKSAMFPLHIWLPDAMEGPTPVSALIHAATMVVAGVYLVARLFPAFALASPVALDVVAVVGVVSAFLAAAIACTQTDIKRVLAYSTMSQIGFMMFSLGVARWGGEGSLGYTASMFHLFTHAMFKALLFLAAGVVIHLIHSNEMTRMGGLRKQLPVTHVLFLIACLAIAGIPPLSGFFSKEEILLAAYKQQPWIYALGLITSGLTAFYMFRLYFMIFWNREPQHHHGHGEGSPAIMVPLFLLAAGTAFAGFIPFGRFVTADRMPHETHLHLTFSILPVFIAAAGMVVAAWLYRKPTLLPEKISIAAGSWYTAAFNKFYIDEMYLFITKKIIFTFIGMPAAWFDKNIVDGLVNLTGRATETVAEGIRELQSGKVQQYAIWFFAGILMLTVSLIYLWRDHIL